METGIENSLEELINTEGHEPIGKPIIISILTNDIPLVMGGKPKDSPFFQKRLEESRPEGATSYIAGNIQTRYCQENPTLKPQGHNLITSYTFIPIQFYR